MKRTGTRRGRWLLVPVLGALLAGCWIEAAENPEQERSPAEEADLEDRVREMLRTSAAGWNAGDLDTFMSVYLDSPETTYVGESGLRVGYAAIRERYAPLFAPGADRDSLRFEELRVRSIDEDVAVGTARYVLHSDGAVTGSGPFTLVLRLVEDEWKIVHDHSSSDPEPRAAESIEPPPPDEGTPSARQTRGGDGPPARPPGET